ncbi:hypothetical protein [Luteibacter aegosomatissinici]|uniref:hypothetical protein n=1 Tax=Luteibacter aegosomatissinici TaxID=2911539 RepID=UPI001FF83935|nr:hypothetical protein [Luteibacter aegosomatissinici]UPG92791.1 hypothetical protein L2Y97_13045 [Luteibacter aegosomatissinici]
MPDMAALLHVERGFGVLRIPMGVNPAMPATLTLRWASVSSSEFHSKPGMAVGHDAIGG